MHPADPVALLEVPDSGADNFVISLSRRPSRW